MGMILIGENIHILDKRVSEALWERNPLFLQGLAIKQAAAKVDYLDLNIGPVRKDPEAMRWLVEIIQEVVDLPLSLDTLNPKAMEAGLAVCKKKPLLNSASGREDSKREMLPLAKKYDCDVILSVLTDKGIPFDAAARVEAIMETIAYANEIGIPNENIWVDPIMMPIGVDQSQVVQLLEFMSMLPDIAPGAKSTLGLSNMINGVPRHLRSILSQVELVMLQRHGLYSAIVDSFDSELIALIRGERPTQVELIYRAMDEEINPVDLLPEEAKLVKTVNVLMGRTLYSHSWLEI
jgi:cobalamin-dependent methionine synthase I